MQAAFVDQWIPGGTGAKRPEREADRLSPLNIEVKNAWSSPKYVNDAVTRYGDEFTFCFYIFCEESLGSSDSIVNSLRT
jgi:hypothetical protein